MKNHFWIIFLAGLSGVFGVMAMTAFTRLAKVEKQLAAAQPARVTKVAPAAARSSLPPVTKPSKPAASVTKTEANGLYLSDVYVEPDGDVIVRFDSASSLVLPENLGQMVKVEPDIGVFTVTANASGSVKLVGAFKPRGFYTLVFKPGWANEGGGRFDREQRISVRIPDRPVELRLVSAGPYFPLQGSKLELPYTAQNVTNIAVQIWRAYENNINAYGIDSWEARQRMVKVVTRIIALHDAADRKIAHMLDFGALLTNRIAGVYRIELSPNAKLDDQGDVVSSGGRSTSAQVILTDLGLQVATPGDTGSTHWFCGVNRLSDGRPVSGAEITVQSYENQVIATGVTDAEGKAVLTNSSAAPSREYGVTVRSGNDFVYFKPDGDSCLQSAQNWNDKPNTPHAFVFMERGVCRPGETFTASAFVRTIRDARAGWQPLAHAPFQLTLTGSSGKKLVSRQVTSDAAGFVGMDFTVPKDAPTGRYTVEAGLGNQPWGEGSIRIEAFVPDRIRVGLREVGEAKMTRDALKYAIDAKYYFGSDIPEASYTFQVSAAVATTYPKHWAMDDSWSVGDAGCFHGGRDFLASGQLSASSAQVTYPGFTNREGRSYSPVKLLAQVSVQEPGGRSVSANVSTRVYPSDWLIGVRHAESQTSGRESLAIRLLPVGPSFRLRGATTLTCSVSRVEWAPHDEKNDRGFYTRVWHRDLIPMPALDHAIVIPSGTQAAGWQTMWAMPTLEMPAGCYEVVVASGKDIRTRTIFWHDEGEASERATDPAKLTFIQEAPAYEPGQTAKLKTRVARDSLGYIVAGERGLSWTKVVSLKAGENEIEIPIPSTVLGSRYFAGVTVIAAGPARSAKRAFGLAEIVVDQSDHKLDVRVDAPEIAKPGEQVTLTASVAGNRSGHGQVHFLLVDEGVLALTRFETPDLFGYFYGKCFGEPFSFYDLYDAIYPELKILPNGQIGGDGDLPPLQGGMVSQKPTVRLVLPPVALDAEGNARATISVPDHLGALRVMAVASADRAVGSGDAEMQVRDAVSVTLSAPRFAVAGDKMQVTAALFNHDCAAADGYKLQLAPPAKIIDGQAVTRVGKLAQGRSTVLWFPYTASASAIGSGPFTASLSMEGGNTKAEAPITVRPAVLPLTKMGYQLLRPGEVFDSRALAAGWVGGFTGSCAVAASPAVTLRSALDWLNAYPYGCLEQTVSGAFPFLSLKALTSLGLISASEAQDVRARRIEIACGRLMGMLHTDGSFSMWPGQETTWPEGSLYASHFLMEAERGGFFTMRPVQRRKVCEFLASYVDNRCARPRFQRAYAAYVLSLAGDERFVNAARGIVSRDTKDPAAFFAAAALITGGYAAEGARPMYEALAAHVWEQNLNGAGSLLWSTEASRLGSTLYILEKLNLRAADTDATALALRLNGLLKVDGRVWGTTQANAWAALGLAAYAEKCSLGTGAGRVSIGRPAVGPASYPFSCGALQAFPISEKNPLVISNASSSAVFLTTRAIGIPVQAPASGGTLGISRVYLNGAGNEVTKAKLGDLLTVRITIDPKGLSVDNLVIADLLPAGLEIEDSSLATRAQEADSRPSVEGLINVRIEKRDDRCLVFADLWTSKQASVDYRVRAVCRGEFRIPEVTAEGMYEPEKFSRLSEKKTFTIE